MGIFLAISVVCVWILIILHEITKSNDKIKDLQREINELRYGKEYSDSLNNRDEE